MDRDARRRLDALRERIRDEMERIEAIAPEWLPAPSRVDDIPFSNVVICGAGLSGLSIAFGLKRRGVGGVLLIDQSEAGREGPWITHARMKTLRSPKHLSGPDFGIPGLTPRSWYEALKGPGAWDRLDKMCRHDWMDYLVWYRNMTGAQVHNGLRLEGVRGDGDELILSLKGNGPAPEVRCRHLVLATGLGGCGGPHIPEQVRALPRDRWTHSAECGDISFLRDRQVVVLGSATSAVDWAVTALEAGAREVTMLARARDMPRTEVLAFTNYPGFLSGFGELTDLERWRLARLYFHFKTPPTQDQFDRACSHGNFRMAMGRKIGAMAMEDGKVRIETDQGQVRADHILLGTGYELNLAARPELASVADRILLWRDQFEPPEGEEAPWLGAYPYLGSGFELKARDPASDSWLSRIHLFNAGAIPSLGPVSNGVTGLKYGLARIVDGLVKALFAKEACQVRSRLAAYNEIHFDPLRNGFTMQAGREAP